MVDSIIRLKYQLGKKYKYVEKNDKKKIDELYYLLDEFEKKVKIIKMEKA